MKRGTILMIAMATFSLGACSLDVGAGDGTGGAGGGGGEGGDAWDGHIIHGTNIALGAYALAVAGDDGLTFRPEPGSDESDTWHGLLPAATYDLSVNQPGGTAAAHYRLARKDDLLAFDISMDAANTGTAVSASCEMGWLLVGVRKPGATKFRMDVTCTGIMVSATGQTEALVAVMGETPEGDQLTFCRLGKNGAALPSDGAVGGSSESQADETGYAVFQYISPTIFATAPGPGVSHAEVHMEFHFVPLP